MEKAHEKNEKKRKTMFTPPPFCSCTVSCDRIRSCDLGAVLSGDKIVQGSFTNLGWPVKPEPTGHYHNDKNKFCIWNIVTKH